MFRNKRNNIILALLCALVFCGCPSEEYTSAKLYLQQNDLEKAEEFLVKAMAVEVDNPEIPFQLGHHIYGKDGRWTEMNEVYDRALAIDPNRKILEGSTVQEMVEISRFGYWSVVYNNAVKVYNSSKDLDEQNRKVAILEAISEFQTASEIKADESLNYTMLATSYFELGEIDEVNQIRSAELIVKAVEINPQDFNANMTAGQIFSRISQPENALQYLQKAVGLDPGNTAAIRNLAQAYYDLGNVNESIATYEKAIRTTVDMKTKAEDVVIEMRKGSEVTGIGEKKTAPDDIGVINPAFDMTPPELISGIITEKGVATAPFEESISKLFEAN